MVSSNLDILLISETKLNESFPVNQFIAFGYSVPYRLDRISKGGGLLLYIKETIPSRLLKSFVLEKDIQALFIETNFRKCKWLIICCYNPNKLNISRYLDNVSKGLNFYYSKYDKILLMRDFNVEMSETNIKDFCETFHLKGLIKTPTCFKKVEKPSTIDLFITNSPKSFIGTTVLESGLSDFHKLIVTVLKIKFEKAPPRILQYRNYKNFDNNDFRQEINDVLINHDIDNISYGEFMKCVTEVLDRCAPKKQKYIRANHSPFVTKELRKAIMKRSNLRNTYLNVKSEESWIAYKKQRNKCVYLVKNAKRSYFANLNISSICDNKTFWRTVSPLFSNKIKTKEKITLIENNEIISSDKNIAEIFMKYFDSIVPSLKLPNDDGYLVPKDDMLSTDSLIIKYKSHPSILSIKQKMGNENFVDSHFSFVNVSLQEIKQRLKRLHANKAQSGADLPAKVVKANIDLFANFIYVNMNNSINDGHFPSELKLAEIIPLHKKDDKTDKSNFRPVSILPLLSKVYEGCIYSQVYQYFDKIFSKEQCGFRKGYNTQHCLLKMTENWKKILDKGGHCAAVLTDLSKAFDCIPHDLIIAKFAAYRFDKHSLSIVNSYLNERKQRVRINSEYSNWSTLIYGVPQGSILGPLFFNIFICDMFDMLPNTDIVNFADDTTPYVCHKNMDEAVHILEEATKKTLKMVC